MDIQRVVDDFCLHATWPRGCNASFIVLIPKVASSQGLNEFRHISLIGCLYKIVAKVIARRLQGVLPALIDERQSAFWGGAICWIV